MSDIEKATLGGGCYWCLEAFYQRIGGVNTVRSGYSGGHLAEPTSEQVYSGSTGHAEVVQLDFNPNKISYQEILEIFFVMHDPTTLNRQGNDMGEQYRSIIFYHNETQHKIAKTMVSDFAVSIWKDPIVTQVEKFDRFWPADESMQDYYNRNPTAGYCMLIIDPKIQKLRQKFAGKLK